jgi:hypothetical protein
MLAPSDSSTSALPDEDDTLLPRCRRDVEGVRAVTAGTDDVEQVAAVGQRHLGGEFAHDLGGGGDFADAFLLHAQAHGECGDHDRRHFAAHDLAEQRQHFIMKDLTMIDAAQQGFLGCDRHCGYPVKRGDRQAQAVRKFFSSA